MLNPLGLFVSAPIGYGPLRGTVLILKKMAENKRVAGMQEIKLAKKKTSSHKITLLIMAAMQEIKLAKKTSSHKIMANNQLHIK